MRDSIRATQQQIAMWRPRQIAGIEVMRGIAPHSAPRHFHEEFEIGFNLGAGWQFHQRGFGHTVAAGTLVVTPPGEVHWCSPARGAPDKGDDAIYYGLRLDADVLRRVATDLGGRAARFPDIATPLIEERDTRARFLHLALALTAEPASRLAQDVLLHDALSRLILRHAAARPTPRPVGAERKAVRRARHYLEAHAERTIALTELARVAELSAFHLCRAFGAAVGMPPHAYQTQLRVVRAKALLLAGQLPLAQIATEVGFASQSHLTRHFARLVGVTPGRYARAIDRHAR